MANVMEFTAPAEAFPLGSVFETLPGATVELERLIPHGTQVIPYFWVRDVDVEDGAALEAAFDGHAGLVDVELVDHIDGEYLLCAEWAETYFGILNALTDANVVLLSSIGRRNGWTFEVRGESADAIREFQTLCQQHDIPIDITAIHALVATEGEGHRLTDAQREALVLAYKRGYFDSPRETTLEAIASELDITQQSLSSRLRRGHRRLIEDALITS